jgi:hypothetical protein
MAPLPTMQTSLRCWAEDDVEEVVMSFIIAIQASRIAAQAGRLDKLASGDLQSAHRLAIIMPLLAW